MKNKNNSNIGLDYSINSLVDELYDSIVSLWEGDIDGYGRLYKNYRKNGYVAEYYISENDYKPVSYNDNKAGQFFFLVDDDSSTDDGFLYKIKCKCVFFVNLVSILGEGRKDQQSHNDVLNLLRDINGDYQIKGIETGVENVFRGYDYSKLLKNDTNPKHIFSVNLELNYYLDEGVDVVVEDNDNGGGAENPNAPVIIYSSFPKKYIRIGYNYEYQIEATNNPTSFSVFNIIDGLSVNETTGLISGIINGKTEGEFDSMSVEATNSSGTGSQILYFYFTNFDTSTLLAPVINVTGIDKEDNSFYINWEYPKYDKIISFIEIYKDDVLRGSIDGQRQDGGMTTGTLIQFQQGINDWKVRFKDEDGNFSDFSNTITVDMT